jgi:cytochrome b6-f complex iron-sulfur subunit
LDFVPNDNNFFCSGHGSTFSPTGAVTKGPAAVALKKYNTAISGNNLRVFA